MAMVTGPSAPLENATVVLLHLVADEARYHTPCVTGVRKGYISNGREHEEQREKNMDGFKRGLPRLKELFLDRFPYPVTIFYSPFAGWDSDFLQIQGWLPGVAIEAVPIPCFNQSLFYRHAPRSFETYVDTCNDPSGCDDYPFSYRQMNYIFTYAMFFETEALAKYKYWMRMDADLMLTNVAEDPFKKMRSEDWVFSYRDIISDNRCNVGFQKEVKAYSRSRMVQPLNSTFFNNFTDRHMEFYGNLGAGYVPLFRSDSYRKLVTSILIDTGNVWKFRWDDQHMYAYAISLLAQSSQIGQIPMSAKHSMEICKTCR